jgi:hypothetical protein
MKISIHFEQNLKLSSLATRKTVFGANATALLLFFVATLFSFWFQWQSKSVAPSDKAIAKNAFFQGILPPEEVTIVWPFLSDPEAEPNEYWLLVWTLYGLCHSP